MTWVRRNAWANRDTDTYLSTVSLQHCCPALAGCRGPSRPADHGGAENRQAETAVILNTCSPAGWGERLLLVTAGIRTRRSTHTGRATPGFKRKAKVRAGFTTRVKGELLAAITKQPARTCPFVNQPNSAGRSHWGEGITTEDMAALRWVKPAVVVEVAFVEWTRDGLLRHPRLLGVRSDKSPREVRRE